MANKKAFDPSICFTFFGKWYETIERIESEADLSSQAYRLFKGIAEYSMYDIDPDFEGMPALAAMWPIIEQEIDQAVNRRSAQFEKDMFNEKYQLIIQACIEHPDLSIRKLADLIELDKSMIYRVKKKYAQTIADGIASADASADADDSVTVDLSIGYTDPLSSHSYYTTNYNAIHTTMKQDTETLFEYPEDDEYPDSWYDRLSPKEQDEYHRRESIRRGKYPLDYDNDDDLPF